MKFIRIGTSIRVFFYTRLGLFVLTTTGLTFNPGVALTFGIKITPGAEANNNFVRNVSLKRIN